MDRTVNINSSRTRTRHRQHRFHLDPVRETACAPAKEGAPYRPQLAMFMRILLLLSITWIMGLTRPLFTIAGFEVTGRAIILLAGGFFLLVKSTHEIHDHMEGEDEQQEARVVASVLAVLVQISLLYLVFSLDSVITAVGMVDEIAIMIIAVVMAMIVMMVFAGPVSGFV